MNSPALLWTIIVPLIAGALGTLLMEARRLQRIADDYGPWLRLGGLLAVCAGLLLEATFLALTPEAVGANLFGIAVTTSAPTRYILTAADVSLLCAALFYWIIPSSSEEVESQRGAAWVPVGLGGTATLLTCAVLAADPFITPLLLFGPALIVAALALPERSTGATRQDGNSAEDREDSIENRQEARGYAAAFKHLALAIIAASIWVVSAALIERYGFSLENRGLLQFGIGLLAVGLLVWAGSMPFTASWGDLIKSAPAAALVALGACAPVALVAGLLLLAPVEGSLARGAAAGWLGAMGALLAGLRALGTIQRPKRASDEVDARIANLKAMTVAVAVSWAVYGVLSGSQTGAVGAILVASNVALAVPLLVAGGRWAVIIGVASLVGLPPFGGFAGMVLIAQSAANSGGLWLGMLLAGSGLVGASWLANRDRLWSHDAMVEESDWAERLTDPVLLLTLALAVAQVALFLVSASRLEPILQWAAVPWLTGP